MTVALLVLELHLSEARSLKEKRMVLNRLKDRLKREHNVAVAEVDFQDLWQRSALAVVTVASARAAAEGLLHAAAAAVERELPGEVASSTVEVLT